MADTPQPGATSSIEDQIRLREQKAEALRALGAHPYGNRVVVPHTTGFVRTRHARDDAAALEAEQTEYSLAGRVMALRPASSASATAMEICRSSSRRTRSATPPTSCSS